MHEKSIKTSMSRTNSYISQTRNVYVLIKCILPLYSLVGEMTNVFSLYVADEDLFEQGVERGVLFLCVEAEVSY